MRAAKKSLVKRLLGNESGNALTFTALAMPVLIGGAGVAVDLSQWYSWKRELQFAVDQAAVAGAWARLDSATEGTYATRAAQEFAANLSTTEGIATTPVVSLVDYDGGSQNAVEVTATAGKVLPFSGMFMTSGTQVSVLARATFEGGDGSGHTACLLALDPSADKAIRFNGGPQVTAGCGVAALSTSDTAIAVDGGSSPIDIGWAVAAGGVDDYFDSRPNTIVKEGYTKLFDPFDKLTPPDNPTQRGEPCPKKNDDDDGTTSTASYTITYSVEETISEDYYTGSKKNSLTLQTSTVISTSTTTETETGSSSATVGSSNTQSWPTEGSVVTHGSGNNKWYSRTDDVLTRVRTVTSVVDNNAGGTNETDEDAGGMLLPGTYQGFSINCDVTLSPGIYVIDGGSFDINAGDSITGDGVMFVLKNGAFIKINGGGQVSLTAMTATELIAAGVSASDASELAGMLIFEDPNSPGSTKGKINGNSETYMNGTVYLPRSEIEFTGTAGVTSQCLMVAAKKIQSGGTADLSTFCPPGLQEDTEVSKESGNEIRLVA